MDEETVDGLLGQTKALSMVLNALIVSLDQGAAAVAHANLAIALQIAQEEDHLTSEASGAATRDAIVQAYVGLLHTRASRA